MILNKKKKKKKIRRNKSKSRWKIEDGKNVGEKAWFRNRSTRIWRARKDGRSRKNIETSKASVTWRGNVAKGRVFGLIPAMQGMPRGNTMQYVSNVNILRLVESKYLPFTILYPLTLD